MRILFLTDNFLPHRGGSRVYYHQLLTQMAQLDDIRIITRRQPGDTDFDNTAPYRIIRTKLEEASLLRPLRLQHAPLYAHLLASGLRQMLFFRPDVILAGELVPTGPVAAWLSRLFLKPIVVFTHAEGPATIAHTRIQARLARAACTRASLIVAASENARTGLMDNLGIGAGKIEVILPGVANAHFAPEHRAAPFSKNNPPRLLTVGRLVRRKGVLNVIEALPRILTHHPRLTYTIVGAGPLEQPIRQAIRRLQLDEQVHMTGEIPDETLMQYYAKADCFVLPNHDDPTTGDTEGFVIALGEAAAHGLPVIAGRDGGTAHSVLDGRTGLRIDGRSPQAVADALIQLLNRPEKARKMGQQGREFAEHHLQWRQRATILSSLLNDIVDNG